LLFREKTDDRLRNQSLFSRRASGSVDGHQIVTVIIANAAQAMGIKQMGAIQGMRIYL
jgi:hypothetical protein